MIQCTAVEESGGVFQVRPHREFVPDKGRDKILSLSLFATIPSTVPVSAHSESSQPPIPRNAYDFMKKRQQKIGDPTLERRHASIRMASYGDNNSPLCVSHENWRCNPGLIPQKISAVGALLDSLSRSKAVTDLEHEGVGSLDISSIEILTLYVAGCFKPCTTDGGWYLGTRLCKSTQMHFRAYQTNTLKLIMRLTYFRSSLQIFEDEGHASVHSEKSKEGLSLFGSLDTQSSINKYLS